MHSLLESAEGACRAIKRAESAESAESAFRWTFSSFSRLLESAEGDHVGISSKLKVLKVLDAVLAVGRECVGESGRESFQHFQLAR